MTEPQQPKAAPSPTNTIDNLVDEIDSIIYNVHAHHVNQLKPQIKSAINKTIMESLPKKKNLAYRQGRDLPVLSGVEQRDPDHIKAKKYINHGYNQALEDVRQQITKKYGRADNESR